MKNAIWVCTCFVVGVLLMLVAACSTVSRVAAAAGQAAAAAVTSAPPAVVSNLAPPESTAPAVDLSKPLIDPPGFPPDWVRARAESEEVGMERDCGIVIRCRVWYPSERNWFILSTPFKGRVKNVSGGKKVDSPFAPPTGGIWIHRGWLKQSPANNSNPSPTMDETGNVSRLPVSMWEVRAAK